MRSRYLTNAFSIFHAGRMMLSSCLRNFRYLPATGKYRNRCLRQGLEGRRRRSWPRQDRSVSEAPQSPVPGNRPGSRPKETTTRTMLPSPAVSYEYTRAPSSRMTARSVTKVTLDPPDESAIETLILIDGLGRPIYTSRSISTA